MLAYAYDAKKMVDPWKRWEYSVDGGVTFELCKHNPDWDSDIIYRKRCELIKVGKHEFYRGINYELCIGQTLMPDRFIKSDKDEFGLAYMCQDETVEGFSLFQTQLIIRFKAGEVELEFENEQRCIERLIYKDEESYDEINGALVDRIYQDLSAAGLKQITSQ